MGTRSLHEWLDVLEARHREAPIQLGLERVVHVRDAMGLVSMATVITVAGTNGKGSTCAMLESIYTAAGYRVGCYTSPHLLRYNERVRVDRREVDDQALAAAFDAVEGARGDVPLTYFEHGTLAAWQVFCAQAVDVIILEVGMGGRLDAVNVWDADCAIVTGVALDHMAFLGSNLETIGREKAGIFRPGKPAICADPQVPRAVLEHAAEIGAELWLHGRDFGVGGDRQQWGFWRYTEPPAQGELLRRGGLAYPALRGANQLLNAAAVLMALDCLRMRVPVSMQAVREGLMYVDLPGRFQVLPGKPAVVLDVAHNPQAAAVLAESLGGMGFFPETWAVFGALDDKDVAGVVQRLLPRVDHWLLASLPGPRGLDAATLHERLRAAGIDIAAEHHASPHSALCAAKEAAGEGDRIVVFGSFLTVAAVMAS